MFDIISTHWHALFCLVYCKCATTPPTERHFMTMGFKQEIFIKERIFPFSGIQTLTTDVTLWRTTLPQSSPKFVARCLVPCMLPTDSFLRGWVELLAVNSL